MCTTPHYFGCCSLALFGFCADGPMDVSMNFMGEVGGIGPEMAWLLVNISKRPICPFVFQEEVTKSAP